MAGEAESFFSLSPSLASASPSGGLSLASSTRTLVDSSPPDSRPLSPQATPPLRDVARPRPRPASLPLRPPALSLGAAALLRACHWARAEPGSGAAEKAEGMGEGAEAAGVPLDHYVFSQPIPPKAFPANDLPSARRVMGGSQGRRLPVLVEKEEEEGSLGAATEEQSLSGASSEAWEEREEGQGLGKVETVLPAQGPVSTVWSFFVSADQGGEYGSLASHTCLLRPSQGESSWSREGGGGQERVEGGGGGGGGLRESVEGGALLSGEAGPLKDWNHKDWDAVRNPLRLCNIRIALCCVLIGLVLGVVVLGLVMIFFA